MLSSLTAHIPRAHPEQTKLKEKAVLDTGRSLPQSHNTASNGGLGSLQRFTSHSHGNIKGLPMDGHKALLLERSDTLCDIGGCERRGSDGRERTVTIARCARLAAAGNVAVPYCIPLSFGSSRSLLCLYPPCRR